MENIKYQLIDLMLEQADIQAVPKNELDNF